MNKTIMKMGAFSQIAQGFTVEDGKRVVELRTTASMKGIAGRVISCDSGYLWITQERDPEDYILASGESFRVTKPGTVVVGSPDRGTYRIV